MTSLLLDTHILVWWLLDAPELTPEMRALFENSGHDLVVSAASVWEIGIKQSIGKLTGFENLLSVLESGGFRLLEISARHADLAAKLPLHHKDPFDRMLIAQAMTENLALVSVDTAFPPYRPYPEYVWRS